MTWQPIATAPTNTQPVILYCKGKGPLSPRRYEFGRLGIGEKYYRQDGTPVPYVATHWMPLPQEPKDD